MQKKSFYRTSRICQKNENQVMHMVFCGCNIPPKLYRCVVCHGPKHSANFTLKSMPAVPEEANPFLPLQPSVLAADSLADLFAVLQLCLGASEAVSAGGVRMSTAAFRKRREKEWSLSEGVRYSEFMCACRATRAFRSFADGKFSFPNYNNFCFRLRGNVGEHVDDFLHMYLFAGDRSLLNEGTAGPVRLLYHNTTDPEQRCQSGQGLLRSIKPQKLFYKVLNRDVSALLPKLLHLPCSGIRSPRNHCCSLHAHIKSSNQKALETLNLFSSL